MQHFSEKSKSKQTLYYHIKEIHKIPMLKSSPHIRAQYLTNLI